MKFLLNFECSVDFGETGISREDDEEEIKFFKRNQVLQEAVPIQMIEPITAAPAAEDISDQPAGETDGVKAVAADVDATAEKIDEQVAEPSADVETSVGESFEPGVEVLAEETRPSSTDDVDFIIKQVIEDTALMGPAEENQEVDASADRDQPAATTEERHWFDLPYEDLIARWDAERQVVTASDTDEEEATMDVGVAGGDQQVQFSEEQPVVMEMNDELLDADAQMSLEDILITIPVDVSLPSADIEITKITMGKEIKIPEVNEWTRYLASLPQIPADDKGKAILVEKDPVKGNPAKEHYFLICADIDLLVNLRAQVIEAVDQFFHFFSFKKLATINIEELSRKEEQVFDLGRDRDNSRSSQQKEVLAHCLKWTRTCCSKIVEGSPRDHGAIIARTNTNTPSTFWLRTMICVDGVWVVEPFCDQWVKIPRPVVCTEVSKQCSFVDFFPTFVQLVPTVDITRFSLFHYFGKNSVTPVSVAPHVQLLDAQSASSFSSDESMNFDDTPASISLPADPSPDISKALNQLRASIDEISKQDDGAKHRDTLLLHLHEFEKQVIARLDAQDRVLGRCAETQMINAWYSPWNEYTDFNRMHILMNMRIVDRMGKEEMLQSLKEQREKGEASSGAAASPSSGKGKRKISSTGDKEARHQNNRARTLGAPPKVDPKPLTSQVGALTEVGPVRPGALNMFEVSFVASPSRSDSMQFLNHLVPDRDVNLMWSTPDLEVLGLHCQIRGGRSYEIRWDCHPRNMSSLRAQVGLPPEELLIRIGLKSSSRSVLRDPVGLPPEEHVELTSSGGAATRGVVTKNTELKKNSFIP
ncbi:Tir-nbs-lrr resistance protein [Dorcoceras hygrometricum]|uniref:Tir-nbs-lrr resistance protein n=1 Tax=Dorcoceras hygrometricum TaxID=472368 RepID=A0A2Z7DH06_9LAMI|nr:Tir-nbs-lrr resistance protein [Dorcoceras hygrometricum]